MFALDSRLINYNEYTYKVQNTYPVILISANALNRRGRVFLLSAGFISVLAVRVSKTIETSFLSVGILVKSSLICILTCK